MPPDELSAKYLAWLEQHAGRRGALFTPESMERLAQEAKMPPIPVRPGVIGYVHADPHVVRVYVSAILSTR